jgi:hypothetical protein
VLWFCADNSNGEDVILAIAGAMVLLSWAAGS